MHRNTREDHVLGDDELVARIQRGETSYLGALYDRHADDVRRIVSRLGVPATDVDDIVQNTFIDVIRAATNYDGRENARPWLLGLAVMQVRRHRRSLVRLAARLRSWALEPSQAPATPEQSAETSERRRRVEEALARLSQRKRDVLVLVTMEGLPGEEVASLLGIPVATVWTRLHHARRELNSAVFEEKS